MNKQRETCRYTSGLYIAIGSQTVHDAAKRGSALALPVDPSDTLMVGGIIAFRRRLVSILASWYYYA
jgi:hypothetical protein